MFSKFQNLFANVAHSIPKQLFHHYLQYPLISKGRFSIVPKVLYIFHLVRVCVK